MGKIRVIYLFTFFAGCVAASAQDGVGVGTTSPDASAILDVSSTSKGLLLPRVAVSESTPASPADGLAVYNTSTSSLYVRENGHWYDVFPRGGIIMWSGDPDNLPDGWTLCNGESGTPDLRGRFIVGYDSVALSGPEVAGDLEVNYGQIGNTGGKVSHTLTEVQMPVHNHPKGTLSASMVESGAHKHEILTRLADGDGTGRLARGRQGTTASYYTGSEPTSSTIGADGTHSHSISVNGNTGNAGGSSGTTQAHENRPPYYVLAFIMKL